MKAALLVVLLAAILAPNATAQVPPLPASACGPITIPTAPDTPDPVAPGGTVDVVVEVQNDGTIPALVEVTIGPLPVGWSIDVAPSPSEVGADATGSFLFTLRAAEDAATTATLSFDASGACQTPLPTCPGNACNAGSVNTQVQVQLAATNGFRLPTLGNWPTEYVIAGIVLVGLATAIPFALRKKKGAIVAECPEPLKMVRAGRGTSFPIEIRNASKEAATAHFEVAAVPEGWSAFMPLPEVQLAAREARSLWLMVRSPASANVGDAVDVELRLRDARGHDGSVVRVRAEVQGGAESS